MKAQIILFFFIFLFINSFSQNTFELLVNYDNAQRPTGLIIDKNNNYIISSQEYIHSSTVKYNSILTKVSETGAILDTAYFNNNEQTVIFDIINTENNDYITIGAVYSDNFEDMSLWLMRLDSDFNIIWEKNIITEAKIHIARAKFNSNNNIFITGGLEREENIFSAYLFEINTEGELIDSIYIGNADYFIHSFDYIEINNYIHLFTFGKIINTMYEIIILDNNFNLINSDTIPSNLKASSNNVYNFSDTTYILSGVLPSNNNDIAVVIADTTHNSVYTFCAEREEFDFIAFWDNLSFIDNNNIYLVGTTNMSYNPYEKEPSWILVNNLNDTLGINWQKIIGGDAYYCVMNIIATEDGGCFIAATRSDKTNYYDYDMYFVKLDSNGNVTHINGEELITQKKLIYPNPTSGIINLDSPNSNSEITVNIYDTKGILIIQKVFTEKQTSLNLSNNPAGIYFYHIISENKIIDNGKIILTE